MEHNGMGQDRRYWQCSERNLPQWHSWPSKTPCGLVCNRNLSHMVPQLIKIILFEMPVHTEHKQVFLKLEGPVS